MKILYLQTFPLWGSGSGTYARFLANTVGRHFKVGMVAPDDRPLANVKLYPLKMSNRVAYTGHPEWKGCKLYTQIGNSEMIRLYEEMLNSVAAAVEDFSDLKMSNRVAYTGHPEWKGCKLYTQIGNSEMIRLYEEMLNSVAAAVEDF